MSQRILYPSLMGPGTNAPIIKSSSLDVVTQDDNDEDGYNNSGLEVYNEFVGVANRELINRELVNLENAAVNIDNSSDVIIGPVTQFNVNGNVTIYQGKDGQPIGIDENSEIPNGSCKDQSSRPQKEEPDVSFSSKRKYTLKFYFVIILLLFILTGIGATLFYLSGINSPADHKSNKDTSDSISLPASLGSHQIIPKHEWKGRPAKDTIPMETPVDLVVVKHTGGSTCNDFKSCAKKLQTIQSVDIADKNLTDVYFNFAVGGDGDVYVGRGWNAQPVQTRNNIDLIMIGDFNQDEFTPTMIEATKAFLEYGLDRNMLTKKYRLIAHNQISNTESPGKNVLAEIKKWPHYDNGKYRGTDIPTRSMPTKPAQVT